MAVKRDLFGGAITVQTAPNLIDVSDLRQVPDNQEVFIYANSDVSIVVEILEKVELQGLEDAVKFHFDSLAHDNSAEFQEVESICLIQKTSQDRTPIPIALEGLQQVRKFNHTTADDVRIYMALFRIEEKDIDLVVTFNVPLAPLGEGIGKADFRTFVETLRIVDYGLFA